MIFESNSEHDSGAELNSDDFKESNDVLFAFE